MNAQAKKELFVVHGGEKTSVHMGGKAYSLFTRHDELLRAKFWLVERHILSTNFVNEFLNRCGAADAWAKGATYEAMCALIDKGKFSSGELAAFELICRALGNEPALAARSSAYGDAKGTGAYKSFFFMNSPEAVEYFAKEVIKSHYSKDAARFRRNTGFPDGIAVMVEPLVAEKVRTPLGTAYAPRLSGLAQTYSLWADIIPTTTVFQGIADLKDMDAGITVEIDDRWTTLKELIFTGPNVRNRLLEDIAKGRDSPSPSSFLLDTRVLLESGKLAKTTTRWNCNVDFFHVSSNIDPLYLSLENYMIKGRKFEDLEWAMRAENGKPAYFINQASNKDSFSFSINTSGISGKMLANSPFVQGSGNDSSPVIVHISSKEGWAKMHEIIMAHEKFILLIDADVLGMNWGFELVKSLDSLSHVKAIGFTQKAGGNLFDSGDSFMGTKFGHTLGMLEASGKIIAAFDEFDWSAIDGKRMELDGYAAYHVNATFLCSQRNSRALLFVD